MEPGAKVKMRGVQIGQVDDIGLRPDAATLNLAIDPDQLRYIPANVAARIRASTAFGAKYVELVYPDHPSERRLSGGAVIASQNVATEVDTVFQNLVDLLNHIDPAKLNGVLSAFAEGLRGQGPSIGESITDANNVVLELNGRVDNLGRDWQSLKNFSDTYSDAAQNIMNTLTAASTTSETIGGNAKQLDQLLLSTIGFTRSGVETLGPARADFVRTVNDLEPTTALLLRYNPSLTCSIVGAHLALTKYGLAGPNAANGYAGTISGAFQWGDDPYKYPEHLPIIGAKGGPDGKPGCGSLPDVSKNGPPRCSSLIPAGEPAWTYARTPGSAFRAGLTTFR